MEYVYKIKHKFIKERQETREIENYGFYPYSAEEDDEIVYAFGIKMDINGDLAQTTKKTLEKIYNTATEEQRTQDFVGYNFVKNEKNCFELVVDEFAEKQLTECQLCFSLNGKFSCFLFINSTDGVEYYNQNILDKNIPEIIKFLKENDIIYRKKYNFNWKVMKK